ncbi:hypothetical protein PAI11_14080 [Patulibacter medicamentivorans]|uniref:Metal-dependent HD superfamily phosphohydrolase n=1 Tax=Patulibacter medicamentivorans TaxID=1097667 RepID=H0E3N6_9ACTN|nr:hypothetical protein [Patulibacter medicamentivorans]EHN11709.1 hypothetical protein PAI11_14080 [Patulibacter medicamentivorans]
MRGDLYGRFAGICHGCGWVGRTEDVFDLLWDAYSQPHRRYHDVDHLDHVLREVDRIAPEGARDEDRMAVVLAAFFHDVVYDPRRQDNERRSADMARRVLDQRGVAPTVVAAACDAILATDPAHDGERGLVARWLGDADLAILASPEQEYDRYVDQVRGEYAHVPEELWITGRAQVLRSLLARAALFTLGDQADAERRARGNLRRELATLPI